ncbi:MAG: aminoglycoside phosphotransferase family protein [Dongiaceae bacterium]
MTPDGDPIVTHSSRLLPVRRDGAPAMLKIAVEAEEKRGGLLMAWWDGQGAARVLEQDSDALLLERAEGKGSLLEMTVNGRDDEASRIICAVVARLHERRGHPPPDLIPLARWFQDLAPAAAERGGILTLCAATAQRLLDAPQDIVVLHGDIHHGNILDFGPRGWLAIDPKRLIGERGFDYANLFCNPELATVAAPGRLARQLDVVVEASGLDRRRLLEWILAYAGLSAAWFLSDGTAAGANLKVAELAAAELARTG